MAEVVGHWWASQEMHSTDFRDKNTGSVLQRMDFRITLCFHQELEFET
jgi:hypothetical protein